MSYRIGDKCHVLGLDKIYKIVYTIIMAKNWNARDKKIKNRRERKFSRRFIEDMQNRISKKDKAILERKARRIKNVS